jgi:ankyrin repeat protein
LKRSRAAESVSKNGKGAEVNAVENRGKTALQIAHENHASSVERMLRQHGAKG